MILVRTTAIHGGIERKNIFFKVKTNCFYPQRNYPLLRTAIAAEILFAARIMQVRFLKRLSGKTPPEQNSSGKKIGAESAVLHFVFFEVIVNKMQQSAKENCLLKRNTVPEIFPLTIGSGKTMPFENRHAGCEKREKINRRHGKKCTSLYIFYLRVCRSKHATEVNHRHPWRF